MNVARVLECFFDWKRGNDGGHDSIVLPCSRIGLSQERQCTAMKTEVSQSKSLGPIIGKRDLI